MRVLITGANGQLGQDLLDAFADHDVLGLTRDDLDISSEAAVPDVVEPLRPDLLINAAAWTDVDACEGDPQQAHAINAAGPGWLAAACARVDARLVQISTDYVFGGAPAERGGPAPSEGRGAAPSEAGPAPSERARPRSGWSSSATPHPVNVYGRSKADGEQRVRAALDRHLIVRTSWLAGARGDNFVATVLRLAAERDRLEVVDDQVGNPTYSRDLAESIRQLVASDRAGTWHRTNAGHASRFEVAVAVVDTCHLDVEVVPISTGGMARPAARPAWSVLDDRRETAAGLRPLPPWRDGLERLLLEMGALAR